MVGGTGGIPGLTTPPPHVPPLCFDPKMPILSFSCSFWPYCPNCPPTSRPQLGNPDIYIYIYIYIFFTLSIVCKQHSTKTLDALLVTILHVQTEG